MVDKRTYGTRCRTELLEYLEENRLRCMTAHEIITESKLDIGEATVYRLLAKLTVEGRLKKFTDTGTGAAKYKLSEEGCENHYHLRCLSCGETLCADGDRIRELAGSLGRDYGFSLDTTKTVLYGLCSSCSKRKTTEAES